ncbi:hypothetical protein ACEPAG_3895 [Sanghuangporus baumii]
MALFLPVAIGTSTFCVFKLLRGLLDISFTPGPRPLFSPISAFGAVLPSCSLNPGTQWFWKWHHEAHFNRSHDVIAFVPWMIGSSAYYVSSLEVMKQLLSAENKVHLEKPQDLTLARCLLSSFLLFDILKFHLDYEGTVSLLRMEMFGGVIDESCHTPSITKHTPKYGRRDTHPTSCDTELDIQSTFRAAAPHESGMADRRVYCDYLIESRKTSSCESDEDALPTDILNCLVSSWANRDKNDLDERDVVANMFSLLFAGHETTSGGIVTTLGYLALYPDKQQKAYEEIYKLFSTCDPFDHVDQSRLSCTLSCFWEAERLCPSDAFIPRQLTEDVIIDVARPRSEKMFLKNGSIVMFDLVGIFRNPDTFQDPDIFRPERWENVSEHDIGMFGFGPRACIGRKGENKSDYEESVIGQAGLVGTAFGLRRVPLKLRRRLWEATR